MKNSLNPVAFWSIIGAVAVVLVIGLVLRSRSGYNRKTDTVDAFGQRAVEGAPVYTPPPGAPVPQSVPGVGTTSPGGASNPGSAGYPGVPPGPPGAPPGPPGR